MHQGPFKISIEWRPLALWISHGFIYCPIVYLDKQKGTATPFATPFAEEVLNTPNYLGRGNNGLHTAHFVCLLESSRDRRLHTCTHPSAGLHSPGTLSLLSPGSAISFWYTMKGRRALDVQGVANLLPHVISTSFIPTALRGIRVLASSCHSFA